MRRLRRPCAALVLLGGVCESFSAPGGDVCEDSALALELASVESSSTEVGVDCLVHGLPDELWNAMGVFRMQWDGDRFEVQGVSLDPAFGARAPPRLREVASGDGVVDFMCDPACGDPVIPCEAQPLMRLRLLVKGEPAVEDRIRLVCELPGFENRTTLFDGRGDPIHPRLLDGVVTLLPFMRGDATGDGRVDMSDAVAILERLFVEGRLRCDDWGDGNDDGRLDLSDALFLLGYLFLGTAAPPHPFAEAGLDETSDDLECRPL